jgi:hypothetical protein
MNILPFQESGNPLYIEEWKLSDDLKYLLVKTDYRKVSLLSRQIRERIDDILVIAMAMVWL